MTNDVKNEAVEPQTNEVDPQNDAIDSGNQELNEVETLKKKLAAANKEAAERRVKLKQIESEKELEQQKALQEQGKYQELAEKYNSELQAIKPKFEEYEQKAKAWDEYQEQEKKRLLSELPKELKKNFEHLGLNELAPVVEGFKKKDSIFPVNSGKEKAEKKTFSQLFSEQIKGV